MAIDPEVNRPTADQLQAKEKDDKVARDKVIRYLTDFELIDKARLYPVQLSGGQQPALCHHSADLLPLPSSSSAALKPVANLSAGPFPQ